MKKILPLVLALMLLLPAALAEEVAPVVYVSITDGSGSLALGYVSVPLTDADGDGSLTMNDALINAHAAFHPEGTAAYLAEPTEFGASIYRLWGVENGGSYGYCINDAAAMNPLDPVAAGDHIKAYAFTDLTAWSDLYSFFDAPTASANVGEPLTLTLHVNGFDDQWSPVVLPVSGAALTIDSKPAAVVTDEAGKALLTFDAPGVHIVSATSDAMTLVAPVCIVTVK